VKHPASAWQRSDPRARTGQLPAVAAAAVAQRRPITLRLPRVRRVILRDPVDQAAADTLDAYLRHGAQPGASMALANTIIGTRHLSQAAVARVDAAVARGLTQQLAALRPAVARADRLLSAAAARCPTCKDLEVCADHQHVLHKWWDLRDAAAVDLVNAVVAAMLTRPASARARRAP